MKISSKFVQKLIGVAGLTMVSLMGSQEAHALTATANLNITATVTAACTITAAPVNFGTYTPSANSDAAGSVTVNCTTGSLTYITLGQGVTPGAGSTAASPVRQMSDGGTQVLGYQLYQDAGRTTVWGDTQLTSVGHTGTGAAVAVPVYGRVPSGQGALTGSYADTVVATVNF